MMAAPDLMDWAAATAAREGIKECGFMWGVNASRQAAWIGRRGQHVLLRRLGDRAYLVYVERTEKAAQQRWRSLCMDEI